MMHPFRCQLCGETYLGENAPDRCPFCGAHGAEIKTPALWIDYGKVQMSESSYKNCEKALELELNNTAFYKCSAAKTTNVYAQCIFKRLAKQELEHAELLCRMMGIDLPAVPEGSCKDTDKDNYITAHEHEDVAINFYLRAAAEAQKAGEERVAYVFRHLSDIESEHLHLSNIYW